jgi:hypothetical protein
MRTDCGTEIQEPSDFPVHGTLILATFPHDEHPAVLMRVNSPSWVDLTEHTEEVLYSDEQLRAGVKLRMIYEYIDGPSKPPITDAMAAAAAQQWVASQPRYVKARWAIQEWASTTFRRKP